MHTYYQIFLLLSLFFCCNTVYASKNEDKAHYQEQLERLQKNITEIQQHLKGSKKKRSHILIDLQQLESVISKNAILLKSLAQDVQITQQQKIKLEHDLKQLDQQLSRQLNALSEQMRSAYRLGHQPNLKMLLNQKSPALAGRMQQYFNYFNRSRAQQIEAFGETIKQKKRAETALQQALNKQNSLLLAQKEKEKQQQKQRSQRKNLLLELTHKIKDQEHTLSSMEDSRGRIENLLESLGELLADIPTSPSENSPFASLKGKLPWPTKGSFLNKFGQTKPRGGLKWNGVLIKVPFGTPIHVISHGRVAFSGWLQGFGFITVVNHGDGYMSLYGNSESLFKQTGDWVAAGDIIATAGDSGGQPQSGVYFEIRSRGKPVNPAKWCSSDARHSATVL